MQTHTVREEKDGFIFSNKKYTIIKNITTEKSIGDKYLCKDSDDKKVVITRGPEIQTHLQAINENLFRISETKFLNTALVSRKIRSGIGEYGTSTGDEHVHHVGERQYALSAYAEGTLLKDYTFKSPSDFVDVCIHLVADLKAIHQNGIIHNNIGLQKIVVKPDEEQMFRAKFIDFDEARNIQGYKVVCTPNLGVLNFITHNRNPEFREDYDIQDDIGPLSVLLINKYKSDLGNQPLSYLFLTGLSNVFLNMGKGSLSCMGIMKELHNRVLNNIALLDEFFEKQNELNNSNFGSLQNKRDQINSCIQNASHLKTLLGDVKPENHSKLLEFINLKNCIKSIEDLNLIKKYLNKNLHKKLDQLVGNHLFINKLNEYINKRQSKCSFSLFSFSMKDKIKAANKLIDELSNINVIFSSDDFDALRQKGSDLAAVLSQYKHLLPQTFLQKENANSEARAQAMIQGMHALER